MGPQNDDGYFVYRYLLVDIPSKLASEIPLCIADDDVTCRLTNSEPHSDLH
jgi:hypothetical protein